MKELEMKWIPVKERLPEKDGYYLATTIEGKMIVDGKEYFRYNVEIIEFTTDVSKQYIDWQKEVDPEELGTGPAFIYWLDAYDSEGNFDGYSYPVKYGDNEVVAWMPLPECYEQED